MMIETGITKMCIRKDEPIDLGLLSQISDQVYAEVSADQEEVWLVSNKPMPLNDWNTLIKALGL